MDRSSVVEVLEALGIDMRGARQRRGGRSLSILCPIHDDSDPSFSVMLEGGAPWFCFGCHAQGKNIGELITYLEGTGVEASRARELWKRDLDSYLKAKGIKKSVLEGEERREMTPLEEAEAELSALEWQDRNKADERLRCEYHTMPESEYDPHRGAAKYFLGRGLEPRTCEWWDLGDDPRLGRALLPIRDFGGRLVGVQGRLYRTDCPCGLPFAEWESTPGAVLSARGKAKKCPRCGRSRPPKYLTTAGFDKSKFLFGEHMLDRDVRSGIVVESPMSVLRLWQAGYPNAVATMGSITSAFQHRRLLAWFHDLAVLADGDPPLRPGAPPAGIEWGMGLRAALGRHVTFRPHLCGRGKDPADLSDAELRAVLGPPPGVPESIRTRPRGSYGGQTKIAYWI